MQGEDRSGITPRSPNPKGADRHRRATARIEYALLLAFVGAFLWRGLLPAWKTLNTDFPDYYLAARLYHQGYSLDQVYDWTWIQRQKDHAEIPRPIVTFTLLTPFSLLPALPFSGLPPLEAKHCWLLLNLVFLALAAGLLYRMSNLGARRVALLVFLALVPLRTNFLFGQQCVLLLLLFSLAARFYSRKQPISSGIALAIAAALKIYPGLYILFLARKKQWRGALALLAGTVALWAISAILFGHELVRIYLTEVLPWPLRAEGQDPYNTNWNSFSALLHRLFIAEPELNPHPLVHAPVAYAILQALCQTLIFIPGLWLIRSSHDDPGRENLEWGVFAAMILMLSTNPTSYDFAAMIMTAVFAVDYLLGDGRQQAAAVLVVLYALVCFPTYRWVPAAVNGWRVMLGVPRLWSMTALWLWLLGLLITSERPLVWRARRREAMVFGALSAGVVFLGVATNLAGQRGEFQNYADRLVSNPGRQLATDPVMAGRALLFTTMTNRGYATAEVVGGQLRLLRFNSDSFHPTGVPGSSLAWVDVASRRSSVVRFSADHPGQFVGKVAVEADDAEQPVVSPDLRWLAFIRETNGRGSLWLKVLQANATQRDLPPADRRLSPGGLDVLDVAIAPDDRIVFSARRAGPPRLFIMRLDSGQIAPDNGPKPRRYPAFSPDGRWLAFSQLEEGNWQLWVRERSTHAERELTHSFCNSVAPAWYPDSKHLVYASDCARGYGLTALCRIQAVP